MEGIRRVNVTFSGERTGVVRQEIFSTKAATAGTKKQASSRGAAASKKPLIEPITEAEVCWFIEKASVVFISWLYKDPWK